MAGIEDIIRQNVNAEVPDRPSWAEFLKSLEPAFARRFPLFFWRADTGWTRVDEDGGYSFMGEDGEYHREPASL